MLQNEKKITMGITIHNLIWNILTPIDSPQLHLFARTYCETPCCPPRVLRTRLGQSYTPLTSKIPWPNKQPSPRLFPQFTTAGNAHFYRKFPLSWSSPLVIMGLFRLCWIRFIAKMGQSLQCSRGENGSWIKCIWIAFESAGIWRISGMDDAGHKFEE